MFHQTFTSQDLSADLRRAEQAVAEGAVAILKDGRPAFVLVSIDEYRRLTGAKPSVADLFGDPEAAAFDFEVPQPRDLPRVVSFD